MSKVVFTRQWNNAGGVIDFFWRVKKFFHLQMKLKLGFQGRVRVEKGSGWKAFQSRKPCLEVEVRRCAPAGVLPPARRAPCMGSSGPPSGIECHRCTSYTFSGECHSHPLWYLPQPSSDYSLGYCVQTPSQKPTPECTHSSLNKLGYLIHLFVYLFWLHLTVCGILVPLVRDQTQGPWQWKRSLNHWTPRELP